MLGCRAETVDGIDSRRAKEPTVNDSAISLLAYFFLFIAINAQGGKGRAPPPSQSYMYSCRNATGLSHTLVHLIQPFFFTS